MNVVLHEILLGMGFKGMARYGNSRMDATPPLGTRLHLASADEKPMEKMRFSIATVALPKGSL